MSDERNEARNIVDRYISVVTAAIILGVMGWVGLSLRDLTSAVPVMKEQLSAVKEDVGDLKRSVRDLELGRGPYRGDRR